MKYQYCLNLLFGLQIYIFLLLLCTCFFFYFYLQCELYSPPNLKYYTSFLFCLFLYKLFLNFHLNFISVLECNFFLFQKFRTIQLSGNNTLKFQRESSLLLFCFVVRFLIRFYFLISYVEEGIIATYQSAPTLLCITIVCLGVATSMSICINIHHSCLELYLLLLKCPLTFYVVIRIKNIIMYLY